MSTILGKEILSLFFKSKNLHWIYTKEYFLNLCTKYWFWDWRLFSQQNTWFPWNIYFCFENFWTSERSAWSGISWWFSVNSSEWLALSERLFFSYRTNIQKLIFSPKSSKTPKIKWNKIKMAGNIAKNQQIFSQEQSLSVLDFLCCETERRILFS